MRSFWLALLAALAVVVGAAASATPTRAAGHAGAEFDNLFQRLEVGDFMQLPQAQQLALIARLARLSPAGDAHRQRLLDSLRCMRAMPDSSKALAFANEQLAKARLAHDDGAAIRFLFCRGASLQEVGAVRDGIPDVQRGVALARAGKDTSLLALGQFQLGNTYSWMGRFSDALPNLLDAYAGFQRQHARQAATAALLEIGNTYRRLGYPDKAREYIEQGRQQASDEVDPINVYSAILYLGYAEEDAGRATQALDLHRKALAVITPSADHKRIGLTQLAIATDLNDLHQPQDALDSLTAAQAQFQQLGYVANAGMISFQRGRALADLHHATAALAAFSDAEANFARNGLLRYLSQLHETKALLLESLHQPDAALAEWKLYVSTHDQLLQARAAQQANWLRVQFDTQRLALQNARLLSEGMLRQKQLQSLQRVRHWQRAALALLLVALLLLAILIVNQLRKSRYWMRTASIDTLTAVANRRGTEQFLAVAVRHARARHGSVSVFALDIDHFKQVNDGFGHEAGDTLLRMVADSGQRALRSGDLFGRMGGEEFLAVLPGTGMVAAIEVAERVRVHIRAIATSGITDGEPVTVSVGVATLKAGDANIADLLRRADAALYRAKADGRNRVVHAPL